MAKKAKKTKAAKKAKQAQAAKKTAKAKAVKKKTSKVKKKSESKKAKDFASVALEAGRPVIPDPTRIAAAAATAGPSDEELDMRDRLKAAPRRQAGPPLKSDMSRAATASALAVEDVPPPTEPNDP
jgi:hypothetical protein